MKNKMNKYEVTIFYTTMETCIVNAENEDEAKAYEKKIDISQIMSDLELNHSVTEVEDINFL